MNLWLVVTGMGFMKLPTSFMPTEDQGYVFANIQLPDAASLQRSDVLVKKVEEIIKKHEEVEFVTIMVFDSLDDVREFAGEDYQTAVVPAQARALLARFDKRSQHYEIRADWRGGPNQQLGL